MAGHDFQGKGCDGRTGQAMILRGRFLKELLNDVVGWCGRGSFQGRSDVSTVNPAVNG